MIPIWTPVLRLLCLWRDECCNLMMYLGCSHGIFVCKALLLVVVYRQGSFYYQQSFALRITYFVRNCIDFKLFQISWFWCWFLYSTYNLFQIRITWSNRFCESEFFFFGCATVGDLTRIFHSRGWLIGSSKKTGFDRPVFLVSNFWISLWWFDSLAF